MQHGFSYADLKTMGIAERRHFYMMFAEQNSPKPQQQQQMKQIKYNPTEFGGG